MMIKNAFLIAIYSIYFCDCGVLLWSNRKIEISPFKSFNDRALDELIQDLGHPEVTLYQSQSSLLPEFKQFLNGYYTAYNSNDEINIENATEISRKEDLYRYLNKEKPNSNVLSVLIISNVRGKREVSSTSTTEVSFSPSYKAPKGPVFYKGKYVGKTEELYGLLYSSQPLLLRINTSNIYLGNTADDMVQVDTVVKDSYTRLNVKIHNEEEGDLITLRFIFTWSDDNYWTLRSVKISNTGNNNYDLNVTQKVTAPARFSYHCSGETLFSSKNGNVELYVYDLQTQLNSTDVKFSDAYDCVNFVTVPILSGLFVSGFLGVGLLIALMAIGDIKTMDKFDNYKTKQLVVTVNE